MTNAADIVIRLITLVFVPLMLLSPLAFALPARTAGGRGGGGSANADEPQRAEVRARTIALVIATLLALALWLGAVLASVNIGSQTLAIVARFTWVLFFPLWFLFAVPLLRAKNAAWFRTGAPASNEPVRAARLDNRARTSPVGRSHWLALGLIGGAFLAAILARGLVGPFESDSDRSRWLVFAGSYLLVIVMVAAVLPVSLRMLLSEPEPMDAGGSPELARMYDAHRTAKIRGLFYLLGVGMIVLFGVCMSLAAWLPFGEIAGWIGGLGGSALGIAGAWFGVVMAIHRMRITQFKATLQGPQHPAGPSAGR